VFHTLHPVTTSWETWDLYSDIRGSRCELRGIASLLLCWTRPRELAQLYTHSLRSNQQKPSRLQKQGPDTSEQRLPSSTASERADLVSDLLPVVSITPQPLTLAFYRILLRPQTSVRVMIGGRLVPDKTPSLVSPNLRRRYLLPPSVTISVSNNAG
jgi:hypothetical protein